MAVFAFLAFVAFVAYSVKRYRDALRHVGVDRMPDFSAAPVSSTTSEDADAIPSATEPAAPSDEDLKISRLNGGCEGAVDAYHDECEGQPESCRDPAPLTPKQKANFQKALNRGTYLTACGVPPTMSINICAGIRHGKAEAVTVRTDPFDDEKGHCIAKAVNRLSFPSSNYLQIARTKFAADSP